MDDKNIVVFQFFAQQKERHPMPNRYELVVHFLCFIHILVWIYLLFAWALGKSHALFVIGVCLPLVYIIQSMPCHIIVYTKMRFIQQHEAHLQKEEPANMIVTEELKSVITRLSRIMGIPQERLWEIFRVIEYYENAWLLPKAMNYGRRWFDRRSFMNPLSAQGLIILCYVLNVARLLA